MSDTTGRQALTRLSRPTLTPSWRLACSWTSTSALSWRAALAPPGSVSSTRVRSAHPLHDLPCSVHKYCSPTRSSLQSGRLPVHVNILNADMSSWNPADPVSGFAGVPRNMTGISAVMREGGYATHMVGKWDAGEKFPFAPRYRPRPRAPRPGHIAPRPRSRARPPSPRAHTHRPRRHGHAGPHARGARLRHEPDLLPPRLVSGAHAARHPRTSARTLTAHTPRPRP